MPCPDWDALLRSWQILMLTYFSFHFQALLGLRNYNEVISMMRCHSSSCLLLSHVHDSPIGGHSGYLKSFHRLKQDFWWQRMKSNLKNYIKERVVCQQMKNETCKPTGLL